MSSKKHQNIRSKFINAIYYLYISDMRKIRLPAPLTSHFTHAIDVPRDISARHKQMQQRCQTNDSSLTSLTSDLSKSYLLLKTIDQLEHTLTHTPTQPTTLNALNVPNVGQMIQIWEQLNAIRKSAGNRGTLEDKSGRIHTHTHTNTRTVRMHHQGQHRKNSRGNCNLTAGYK